MGLFEVVIPKMAFRLGANNLVVVQLASCSAVMCLLSHVLLLLLVSHVHIRYLLICAKKLG